MGIRREFLRIIWETVGIHREPLENLWGLLVRNTFVGRGPNTNRAHPHACNIPYKTALPVPCTHRFIFDPFFVTFSLPFFVSFFKGFLAHFGVLSGYILASIFDVFPIKKTIQFSIDVSSIVGWMLGS